MSDGERERERVLSANKPKTRVAVPLGSRGILGGFGFLTLVDGAASAESLSAVMFVLEGGIVPALLPFDP
jgi:hypothetical protein